MSRIKLFHLPKYAPGSYIIARQRKDGTYDPYSDTDTVLVQTDWDFPGVAGTFGGRLGWGSGVICDHESTDGTVDCCECGMTAGALIGHAQDYLDAHEGAEADDPGYFEEQPQ